MKKLFVILVIIIATASCNDKPPQPKVDATPNMSQTNNSVDILTDTLGFKPDSSKMKTDSVKK